MWNPDLEKIFKEFCNYVDGKLNWTATKDKEWSDTIFNFFQELTKKQSGSLYTGERLEEEGEDGGTYMTVDYVVRGYRLDGERKKMAQIVLAVEHENTGDVSSFLKKEIRHLIDLKSATKIAITYPSQGDRTELITRVQQLIQDSWYYGTMKMLAERYLVILGFATTKERKRAVQWQGYIFDNEGKQAKLLERVTFQRTQNV